METEIALDRKDSLCVLSGLRGLPDLSASLLTDLRSLCRVRHYDAGSVVVDAGEDGQIVGFVRQGFLRMQKTQPDGRQNIVGLLVEGDMFGRVYDGPTQYAIEAATEVEAYVFRRGPFEDLLKRSPELDRFLLMQFMSELERARDWMLILANHKVRGRIAGLLLTFCARLTGINDLIVEEGGLTTVRIPIGRPDLANLLGTRQESISRALHALADDGIVRIVQPDVITILDPATLAVEAGEPELAERILQGGGLHPATARTAN